MSTRFERFGTHAILAIVTASLGGFLGGEYVAQGYEDLLALTHTQHTDNILTSLNYIREGDLDIGYRMLEISLESGRHSTEASAIDISDPEILSMASNLLEKVDEYQQSYPVTN